MWKWKIKQDGLTVAKGQAQDKETCCIEAFRYADQYADEDFNKMILTIERKDND